MGGVIRLAGLSGVPAAATHPMHALVADSQLRSALAGVRALGKAGVPVVALAPHAGAAGLWSRNTAVRGLGPDPAVDPDGFLAAISSAAARHGQSIVYAGRDATLQLLLDRHADLDPAASLPYPAIGATKVLFDKSLLPALAREAGVTVPRSVAQGTARELRSAAMSPASVAVKPATVGTELDFTLLLSTETELPQLLRALPDEEEIVVQERFEGPMGSLALVVDGDGRLVARFQHAVRRLWPPEAGSTVEAASVVPDDGVTRQAMRLLAAAGYAGFAQIDFFDTPRGPVFVDVNPRFYASMPLALACGVNLPAAWHAVVTGSPVPAAGPYRAGVSFRWLEADLVAALRGLPHLLLRRSPAPRVGAAWAADDPAPGIVGAVDSALARLGRATSRLLSRGGHEAPRGSAPAVMTPDGCTSRRRTK